MRMFGRGGGGRYPERGRWVGGDDIRGGPCLGAGSEGASLCFAQRGRVRTAWECVRALPLGLPLTIVVSLLTVTAGDADPRAWTPSFTQRPVGAPRTGGLMEDKLVEHCSELRDMRVQLNRAMGQLQSKAQQPSAKEAARELNCWLMQLLSHPHVDGNSIERRALLTNLKRISQLQKDNLKLRLQHVVQHPSGMGSRSVREGICEERELPFKNLRREPLQVELCGNLLQRKDPSCRSGDLQLEQAAPEQALRAHVQGTSWEWQKPPEGAASGEPRCVPQAAETRNLRPRAIIGGRSTAPLDEYAFHRRGPSRATGPLGTTPQAGIRRSDEGGMGSAGTGAEDGSELLRDGGLDEAMRLVNELRALNRELSRHVSDLANDNIRLKSMLNQAQSSVLEAAVAQLSSRTVATERAVPSSVKAASTWHARNLLGGTGGGGVGGLVSGGMGVGEWEGMLGDGTDPSERGRVMASVALLKRLGLRVGQHVKLRRTLSRDRLGSCVNSTSGEFLGVLVGETGTDDATVYLHMDNGQVRQFALSDTVCAPRGITPSHHVDPGTVGGVKGGGLRADLALAAARAAQERGAGGVVMMPGSGATDGQAKSHDRNLLLLASRKMMSQEIKL